MTVESHASGNWERVAAELRACRAAQQKAWGDIDNTTLGRYLADDVGADERQQIESALAELPELRKLTDLVRDVLGESEVVGAAPEAAPAVLPFPQPQARREGARKAGRDWMRMLDRRFRRRAGLVAAACLLLTLGVALPRPGAVHSPPPDVLGLDDSAVAMRLALPTSSPADDKDAVPAALFRRGSGQTPMMARVDASVEALEKQGKKREAMALARKSADDFTRLAWAYTKAGDLDRAEPPLNDGRTICETILSPTDPVAVRNRNTLAEFYQVALNAPEATQDTDAAPVAPPSPPSTQPTARDFVGETWYPAGYQSMYQARVNPYSSGGNPYTLGAAHPAAHAKAAVHKASGLFVIRDRLTHQPQRQLKASVVPVLTQALREAASPQERAKFARALGKLGPAARDAVPVLADCLRRAREPKEQAAVLAALAQIGPAARRAVPALLHSVRSDNPEVRRLVQKIQGPEGRVGIDDECECFSVNAIHQAQREILTLAQTSGVEVRVETTPTFAAGPGARGADREEAADLGPRCVCIRISKADHAAFVQVSDALRKEGLSDAKVRQVVEARLRQKDFDGSVRDGVHFLEQFQRAQTATPAAPK
jgi:hypothetical protein